MDVPVFTKKHCDLPPVAAATPSPTANIAAGAATNSNSNSNTPTPPTCACSSTFHQLHALATSTPAQLAPPPPPPSCGILPFSSNFSAKICLKSALSIARSFASLPYPQPLRRDDLLSYFPPMSNPKAPRLVPVFACCAMQSAYAMIMLGYKTRAMGFGGNVAAERLLGQLQEGLGQVLEALGNYSLAYEALGGQRDQIQAAVEAVENMRAGGEVVVGLGAG
jgi:hypothetical protein